MRKDVHQGPHTDCDEPAVCDCECRPCKKAWIAAGRPLPPQAAIVCRECGDATLYAPGEPHPCHPGVKEEAPE